MALLLYVLPICLSVVCANVILPKRSFATRSNGDLPRNFRIMTFNVFYAGTKVANGIEKIAKHVKLMNPDIVGFQEIKGYETDAILRHLGKDWYRCSDPQNQDTSLDVTLITRHPSTPLQRLNGFSNIGCRLSVGGATIDIWNHHLLYTNYGPYTACINPTSGNVQQLLQRDENYSPFKGLDSRVESMRKFVNHDRKSYTSDVTILLGDFNVPSHLDWTQAAKSLHCGVSFQWPVSKMLEQNGFSDTFRVAK